MGLTGKIILIDGLGKVGTEAAVAYFEALY
jgi:hypothetical protein